MNADDEKKLREAFEKWVSSSPFECSTERMTEKSAWPGRYRFSSVSLAWEAWQDAHTAGHRSGMTEAAGICESKVEEVQKRLDAGKGEWPKEGYIRDETWHSWQGEGFALRCAAAAIEKARDA